MWFPQLSVESSNTPRNFEPVSLLTHFSAKFKSNLVIRYVLCRVKNNKICFSNIEGQSMYLKPLTNLTQYLVYSFLDIKYIESFVANIGIIY